MPSPAPSTAKLTLTDLVNLQNETSAVALINANSTAIETAIDNTLSRDGTTPNSMGADLDMNSHRILNLPQPIESTEPLRLEDLVEFVGGTLEIVVPTGASQGQAEAGTDNTAFMTPLRTKQAVQNGTFFTQTGTGATARTFTSKAKDDLSVLDFGAVGDDNIANASTNVTAFNNALATGKRVYIPPGSYRINAVLTIAASATSLVGAGRGLSILKTTSAGHGISISTGLTDVELSDFALTRTGVATSIQDGVHFVGLTERARVERVDSTGHYNNFRFCATSFSKASDLFANNGYADGILITNEDAVASGLQWEVRNVLTQQNTGWGIRWFTSFGASAAVGPLIAPWSYANTAGGIKYAGSSGKAINGVRIWGGFSGQEGLDSIYVDTYGTFDVQVQNVITEINGTSPTGINAGTIASAQGRGIVITANNTAAQIVGCEAIGHSWAGLESNCPRILISGCTIRSNAAVAFAGELAGILINAGQATIVGNSSKGQPYGVYLVNDNHLVIGNDLSENTTAPLGTAAAALIISVISRNQPNTTVEVRPDKATSNGNTNYSIDKYDWLVYTSAVFTAPRTWTLPLANTVPRNKIIRILDVQGALTATNTLTIARSGSDTINGATTFILNSIYSGVDVVSDGVSKWNIPQFASSVTVGSTTIASGTSGRVLYDNAGVLGEMTTTGTGTTLALSAAPTFTGAISAGSIALTANSTLVLAQNTTTSISITNTSTGTGASSQYVFSNSAATGSVGIASTGYTTIPILQNRLFLDCTSTSGGIVLNTESALPILFSTSNAEAARVLTGFMVGTTTDPGAGIINVLTGLRVNNAAASASFLRGDGTNFIPTALAAGDIASGTLSGVRGGTGLSTAAVGDIIYASATTPTWSRLADVATGSVLASGGVSVAPAWTTSPTVTGGITVGSDAAASTILVSIRTASTSSVGPAVAFYRGGTNVCSIGTESGILGGTSNNFATYTNSNNFDVYTNATTKTFSITPTASTILGSAALATSATDGFLYIPTCAGTPTGVPTSFTGRIAMVYDTTNHQFWFYDSGWKQPKTPAAAALVTWQ